MGSGRPTTVGAEQKQGRGGKQGKAATHIQQLVGVFTPTSTRPAGAATTKMCVLSTFRREDNDVFSSVRFFLSLRRTQIPGIPPSGSGREEFRIDYGGMGNNNESVIKQFEILEIAPRGLTTLQVSSFSPSVSTGGATSQASHYKGDSSGRLIIHRGDRKCQNFHFCYSAWNEEADRQA